jgi:transglutaminase-like putative cysteine protease
LLEQDFPPGEAIDIYIPLPSKGAGQRILVQSLQSSVPGGTGLEGIHGNAYYHLHRAADSSTPLSASLRWTVVRDSVGTSGRGEISEAEREESLAPDTLVPVDHEILQPILAEIHDLRSDDSPESTARAIYDWVVDNVEYKKVGTGWGNGDTFWACNERYGNCTDFHALFIALARTEGIPARFEIGFPIPDDRQKGEVGGYHCWVHFYLPERGWVPIDASEAAKHPEQREKLYGGYPADRIHFSTGRDLVLSPASADAPLNYFIYPYVEVGGKPWAGKVVTRFSFEEVTNPEVDSQP